MFKGWNLYHKSVAYGLMIVGVLMVAWGAAVIGGGAVEVRVIRTLPASAESIWPWLTEDDMRAKWEVYVHDFSRLQGDADAPGSTRFLLIRDAEGRSDTALEQTLSAFPGREIHFLRGSEVFEGNLSFSLTPKGACAVELEVREVWRSEAYMERFWSFSKAGARKKRLEQSLDSLTYWLNRTVACPESASAEDAN